MFGRNREGSLNFETIRNGFPKVFRVVGGSHTLPNKRELNTRRISVSEQLQKSKMLKVVGIGI